MSHPLFSLSGQVAPVTGASPGLGAAMAQALAEAKRAGCRVLDGGGMAVHQAVDAFRLLTGAQADAARMSRDFLKMIVAAGR